MEQILYQNPWLILILLAWSLPWKGVALWKSARFGNIPWFVVLLVVNTLGILDIVYIFVISKKYKKAECCESEVQKGQNTQITQNQSTE